MALFTVYLELLKNSVLVQALLCIIQDVGTLPGISFPPQEQSGRRHTSLRHLAAVLST
jgi:hypothetical protein